jgi:hypothetical protein
LNKPPIPQLRKVLDKIETIDRTSINSWEDGPIAPPAPSSRSLTESDGHRDQEWECSETRERRDSNGETRSRDEGEDPPGHRSPPGPLASEEGGHVLGVVA